MQNFGNYAMFPSVLELKYPINLHIFDLDETLITKVNGEPSKIPCTDCNNWQFYNGVVEHLREIIINGHYIIIITNQYNINEHKIKLIESVWKSLYQYPLILISTLHDNFRKPNIGLMQILRSFLKEEPSYISYCGDAVGPEDDYIPYRWSSIDKDFAKNINALFFRPRDLFGSNFLSYVPSEDLVIIMGNQGSGKTSTAIFIEKNGYIRFSQDEVGKLDAVKRVNQIGKLLINGNKVVVDATHAKSEYRIKWVNLANSLNKSSVILWHINDGRCFNTLREKSVPEIAYKMYTKNFNYPSETKVVKIN